MNSPDLNADLLIVGGGPAGLTAASEALEAGRSVILVESSERLGGMSASIEVGGQSVDLGSHRLHPSASPEVMAVLERVLGNDLVTRRRNGRIRLGGAWLSFPLQPLNLLRSTPPRFGVKSAVDMLTTPFRRPLPFRPRPADTYAEVVRVGLGPAVLENFYGPYARKLWGVDAEELAGEVARRRISISGPVALLKKLVSNSSEVPVFLYPRLGYGQVVEGLADEVETNNDAQVLTGVAVRRLEPDATGVSATLSDGQSICVRRVFWTAGPHHLAAVLHDVVLDDAPAEASSGSASPTHRGMVLAYLVVNTAQYTSFDAHYFPELQTRSARISEPKNYRDGPDPADSTVLCAELACDVGDETWNASPEVLRDWVVSDLVSNDLPCPVVLDVHVERLPAVYPVIRPADVEASAALADWAASHDRVHVFGRQGLVVADNLHHVMDMALGAVSCLVEQSHDDLWNAKRWQKLQIEFAQNVVED